MGLAPIGRSRPVGRDAVEKGSRDQTSGTYPPIHPNLGVAALCNPPQMDNDDLAGVFANQLFQIAVEPHVIRLRVYSLHRFAPGDRAPISLRSDSVMVVLDYFPLL